MTAGFEDTEDFLEDTKLVGNEVEDAIANDDIGGIRGDGHFFDIALAEFYVAET